MPDAAGALHPPLKAALVDIVVDDQRHILYTRSQSSVLQVFDLGADGKAAPSRAADSSDFLHDAARALGGRDVFGRGGEPGPTCRRGALPGFGGCSASLPRMG
jgi:hypothetical protein